MTRRRVAAPEPASGRLRVALVAHDIHDHGGMERVFAELIRNSHRTIDFLVVSRTLQEDLRPLVEWRRVPVPGRPFPAKFGLFFLMAGCAYRRSSVQVVHTLGAIIPRKADLASVHFCHLGYWNKTHRRGPAEALPSRRVNTTISFFLGLWAEQWSYRRGRVGALAAVSPGGAREVNQAYPDLPVFVTPNGVDSDRFVPNEAARGALRAAAGVGVDEVVLLFVASRWEDKGLDVVLAGLRHAIDRTGAPLRLWVVGSGTEASLNVRTEAHGVKDRVQFFGRRTDTERYYQAADVFVLPTLYETFSMVAHEAACCGLPVVATPVSGIEDLLAGDQAGIAVRRDPTDVGDAIARLAIDKDLRDRMGQEARRRGLCFTWTASSQSVVTLYEKLAARQVGTVQSF